MAMKWLSWIYRRWGQVVCFTCGGVMMLLTMNEAATRPGILLGSGAVFFATAIGLKALAIWSEGSRS